MTADQMLLLGILLAATGLFIWGRWRHDMVALAALMACVLTGLVDASAAFSGFGHPAVITVACVLVLSRGLQTSGAVDVLARRAIPSQAGVMVSMTALVGLGALMSGFMNNVGAMALLMPVAIKLAQRLDIPPGRMLMPLAFGTILGGMTTLIGTPPNLIVSGFRAGLPESDGFAMFDFFAVGIAVAAAGVIFVVLTARFLVPVRKQPNTEGFQTGAYLTEARVSAKSKAAGMTLREAEDAIEESGAQIVALIRNDVRISAPHRRRRIAPGDILVLEADADALGDILSALEVKLEEHGSSSEAEEKDEADRKAVKAKDKAASVDKNEEADEEDERVSAEEVLREYVVLPEAQLIGRSARDMLLRTRFGINLLAVSREGRQSRARLRTFRLRAGDVLLMHGPAEALAEFAADSGCAPLAERDLRIPDKQKALIASALMAGAVGGAAFGLMPAAISFALGVLASMVFNTVPARSVYKSIDWPVIVLLAALLPVAGAMESTGSASLIADGLIGSLAQGNAILALVMIMVATMILSDLMNNAATAAVMCPIAIGVAAALGVSADTYLMAVAIGASCAFLTPIGHQNNTLILGPGGFHFSDYWRLGLPLQALVLLVGVPMLLWIWPL